MKLTSGVRNESDPALALLADHVESSSHAMRCGASVGLGVAYAGGRREDVVELLTPLVANTENANMVEVSDLVSFRSPSLPYTVFLFFSPERSRLFVIVLCLATSPVRGDPIRLG